MSVAQGRILIADDDQDMAQLLGRLVQREGLTPLLAKNGMEALQLVRAGDPDVLLTDLRMPGMDGMELMRKAKDLDPELPVVLITGFAEVRSAVEAIRAGAHDFLAKPFQHPQVLRVLLRALNERRLKLELRHLADHVQQVLSPRETFGPSEAIGGVISAIEQVAKSNFSVVIVGETGSGKEVVARAIHQASGRKEHPFVPLDCGAVPETLIESELFGHERGAFTGADQQTVGKIEAAHTGTLFLDEISNMPLASQAKLLRVLQERTLCRLGGAKAIHVDVRMLTASGQDLEGLCEGGAFRPDLYFRLNEFTISIPPLRERREDILYLAKRFLDIANIELPKSIKGFSPSAIEAMLAYRWPGNVRQLRSVVRRAVLMAEDVVTEEHLGLRPAGLTSPRDNELAPSWAPFRRMCDLSLRETVRSNTVHVERIAIVHALRRTGGNKAKAARLLQVDYKTLHSKVKEYGIQVQIEGEQPHGQETQ
ncbi:MAG: sigma-54 dependent transcriptional regulator [Bryobacteraceae bacterium]|jgi:two-component system nitrogen regulation response regulator GlnG